MNSFVFLFLALISLSNAAILEQLNQLRIHVLQQRNHRQEQLTVIIHNHVHSAFVNIILPYIDADRNEIRSSNFRRSIGHMMASNNITIETLFNEILALARNQQDPRYDLLAYELQGYLDRELGNRLQSYLNLFRDDPNAASVDLFVRLRDNHPEWVLLLEEPMQVE